MDLKTGKRKWHFQIVHHPIWDYDLSSAPILADINVDGKAIKAVALPSKEAFLYVFDRVTGKPVWPIEERPVPQSDVPGEKTSPTQPFPTKPPAYARNFINVPDDLIDFTPEMRAQAKDVIARYQDRADVHSRPWSAIPTDCWARSISATPAAAPTGRARATIPKRTSCTRRPISRRCIADFAAHAAAGLLRYPLRDRAATISRLPRIRRAWIRQRRRCSAACKPRAPQRPAAGAAASCRRRDRRRPHRSRPVHRQAALRRHLGHQSRSRRHPMAGAVRRDAGQRSQSIRRSRA